MTKLLLLFVAACAASSDASLTNTTTEDITVNGIELVTKTSETSSTWWRSPEAYCSAGKSLWGLGSTGPENGSVLFRGLLPIQGYAAYPTEAKAAAQEDLAGTTANWSMTAYGICGIDQPDLKLVQTNSGYSSASTRTWTVNCPAGKKVIGAGGTIFEGEGRVKIDEIRPNASLDQVTVTASEDQDGTTAAWSVQAYAICATPPPGLQRIATVATSGWDGRTVVARCPSEQKLLSSSGGVFASVPTAMRVFEIRPSSDLTSTTVRVTTKGSTSGVTGEVRSYAICADG
jgi:hypothetical protein